MHQRDKLKHNQNVLCAKQNSRQYTLLLIGNHSYRRDNQSIVFVNRDNTRTIDFECSKFEHQLLHNFTVRNLINRRERNSFVPIPTNQRHTPLISWFCGRIIRGWYVPFSGSNLCGYGKIPILN